MDATLGEQAERAGPCKPWEGQRPLWRPGQHVILNVESKRDGTMRTCNTEARLPIATLHENFLMGKLFLYISWGSPLVYSTSNFTLEVLNSGKPAEKCCSPLQGSHGPYYPVATERQVRSFTDLVRSCATVIIVVSGRAGLMTLTVHLLVSQIMCFLHKASKLHVHVP